MLSNACEYGIRALVYMALENSSGYISVGKMSEDLDISFHFLTKTLQHLTRKNILKSYRGPSGGLLFVKEPNEITLLDIVEAIDGDGIFTSCIIGLPGCSDDNPCPFHESWGVQRSEILDIFKSTTIGQVAENVHNNPNLVLNRKLDANEIK